MSIDIREGDILVNGGNEYPIRSAAYWEGFASKPIQAANKTYSTKRSPAISSGKRGEPATNLVGLSGTPLDPVDPDIQRRLGLDTPHELLQTYIYDASGFIHLIVEELKR